MSTNHPSKTFTPSGINIIFYFQSGAKADVKDLGGLSALMIAVQFGHVNTCKVLLAAGADVNGKEKQEGTSVLMTAIKRRQLEVVEVLLSCGARVDDEDKKGNSVRMMANKWKNKTLQSKLTRYMKEESAESDEIDDIGSE